MHYAALLVVGFVKALFWSGGWYWRPLLLVGFLPGFHEELLPVLEVLGADQWPAWYFYLSAAVGAAAVFAGRIAYLETPKLVLKVRRGVPSESADTSNGNKTNRYLLEILNNSWQQLDRCSVQVLEIKDEEDNTYAFLPIGLRAEHQHSEEPTFNLSPGERKTVLFISLIELPPQEHIVLHYQYTKEPTPNLLPSGRKYVITVGVFSAGSAHVRSKFSFHVERGRLMLSAYQRQIRVGGWNIMFGKCA